MSLLFDSLMSMKPKYFNFMRLIHEIIINFILAKKCPKRQKMKKINYPWTMIIQLSHNNSNN